MKSNNSLIKEETIEKYFKALTELKMILEYQPKIGLQPFCVKKGLNKNASVHIMNGGLVKNIGSRGKGAEYVWNTINPNLKMAKELLKRCNISSKVAMRKTRGSFKTIVKYLKTDYTITEYLWGLIKIKTKYYYKICC